MQSHEFIHNSHIFNPDKQKPTMLIFLKTSMPVQLDNWEKKEKKENKSAFKI